MTLSNEAPRSASSSDLLLGAEGRLSDAWALAGLLQYNFDSVADRALQRRRALHAGAGPRRSTRRYRYTRQLVDPTGGTSSS